MNRFEQLRGAGTSDTDGCVEKLLQNCCAWKPEGAEGLSNLQILLHVDSCYPQAES